MDPPRRDLNVQHGHGDAWRPARGDDAAFRALHLPLAGLIPKLEHGLDHVDASLQAPLRQITAVGVHGQAPLRPDLAALGVGAAAQPPPLSCARLAPAPGVRALHNPRPYRGVIFVRR